MQLMSSEIQRQREVDNKIRRREREFRYRQKKKEELKEKKFWEQMRVRFFRISVVSSEEM